MGFLRTSLIVLMTAVAVSILPGYLTPKLKLNIRGSVAPGWEKVEQVFRSQVESGEQEGGSFSVYYKGEQVVHLMGGYADPEAQIPWKENTVNQLFSTTKGISALVIAMLVDRGQLDYKKLVKEYWPEFAVNGKEKVTVEQLFSHQAGLITIDGDFTMNDVYRNTERYRQVLAEQKPEWEPGTAVGYHAITIGYYEDVMVQKSDPKGRTLARFFKEEIAEPLGLDIQIGLPYEDNYRCARVIEQGGLSRIQEIWYNPWIISLMMGIMTPSSPFWKTIVPKDYFDTTTNDPETRKYPVCAAAGFGDAKSMAKLFGIVANGGKYNGKQYFSSKIIESLDDIVFQGKDVILADLPVNYGRGFLILPNKKNDGGTFGTPGAGGQMGYGDAKNKLGWGYTSNFHKSSLETETYKALWNAMYDSLNNLKK